MNFWTECKMRVSVSILRLGSKAKMSRFSPIILLTFYWLSGSLSCTVQHIKNLESPFSVSARYGPFWLLTWSKMKNFDFSIKHKSFNFYKHFFCFMEKVKIFYFWLCQKSKWAIAYPNKKTLRQIFHMLYNTWQTTRI